MPERSKSGLKSGLAKDFMNTLKAIIIFSAGIFLLSCAANTNLPTKNANIPPPENSNNSLTVSSRSQNNSANPPVASSTIVPKSGAKTKWTQGGAPIDTKEFDAEIAKAEKNLKAKPKDETAKRALAESYFKRGFALTEARQYAAALGDYRKALKLDPNYVEAKTWINQIIEIYDGLNKDYPEEGKEPPALSSNK